MAIAVFEIKLTSLLRSLTCQLKEGFPVCFVARMLGSITKSQYEC